MADQLNNSVLFAETGFNQNDGNQLQNSVLFTEIGFNEQSTDPYDANVVFQLIIPNVNNSVAFTEKRGRTITVNGDTKASTAQLFNGNASALFDGNLDYLSVADSADWYFASSDFTIEIVLYMPSYPASYVIPISQMLNATERAFWLNIDSAGAYAFRITRDGTSTEDRVLLTANGAVSTGQWQHVSVTRSGNNYETFVNGASVATGVNTYPVNNSAATLKIGTGDAPGTGFDFNGYMGGVRITKGVARANGGYNDGWGFTNPGFFLFF